MIQGKEAGDLGYGGEKWMNSEGILEVGLTMDWL